MPHATVTQEQEGKEGKCYRRTSVQAVRRKISLLSETSGQTPFLRVDILHKECPEIESSEAKLGIFQLGGSVEGQPVNRQYVKFFTGPEQRCSAMPEKSSLIRVPAMCVLPMLWSGRYYSIPSN